MINKAQAALNAAVSVHQRLLSESQPYASVKYSSDAEILKTADAFYKWLNSRS